VIEGSRSVHAGWLQAGQPRNQGLGPRPSLRACRSGCRRWVATDVHRSSCIACAPACYSCQGLFWVRGTFRMYANLRSAGPLENSNSSRTTCLPARSRLRYASRGIGTWSARQAARNAELGMPHVFRASPGPRDHSNSYSCSRCMEMYPIDITASRARTLL
jgi:hypothetical protein